MKVVPISEFALATSLCGLLSKLQPSSDMWRPSRSCLQMSGDSALRAPPGRSDAHERNPTSVLNGWHTQHTPSR